MDVRIATVDGKLVDVITTEEYSSKWRTFQDNPSMYQSSALDIQTGGNRYILPFRGKTDDRPGIYNEGAMYRIKLPKTKEEENEYSYGSREVVDIGNSGDVKTFLNRNKQVRDMEAVILTDIDDVYTPPMLPNDSPEMRAFKEAVASKHCDINKYAPRFGDNFLNDKRILKTPSITMNKLVSMSEKMDIEVELILRNAGDDVPNPMDRSISVILTGKGGDNNE